MATVKVRKGEIYTAAFANSGVSQRGNWELVRVTDAKGKDSITIFIDNCPTGIQQGMQFKVTEITELKYGPKKEVFHGEERWVKTANCCANIEVLGTPSPSFDEDIGDAELPWTLSDPFALSEEDQLPL